MPTKKTEKVNIINLSNNPNDFLSAVHGSRIEWGIMTPTAEEKYFKEKFFQKSTRSDYGRVIDITIPLGYHAQAKKAWEMYDTDRLFRYLIDRCSDFGANGFEWEVPIVKTKGFWDSIKNNLFGQKETKEEKEKIFWDTWSARLNEDVPNVIPGIDEINKWIFKHLLLSAMIPLEWEWGQLKINGETYNVPIRMVSHNPLSIALVRDNQKFISEKAYLKISLNKTFQESNKAINVVSLYENPQNNPSSWHELNLMNINNIKGTQEAFVLKYNWTPGDNTTLIYGRSVSVGQGLYPTPPFVGLYESLVVRRALHAADLAILDGVIHYILDWTIGDDTRVRDKSGAEKLVNQPRPEKKDAGGAVIEESTISLAKKIITSDTRGPVMQIFHPYYIKLEIKMPDIQALINADKYLNSTQEIYEGFGILIVSTGGGNRRQLDINTANFEEMLNNIRRNHIKRFWEALCTEIIKRNRDKLTTIPNMIFNSLNTKSEQFKTSLLTLAKMGKISSESLLQAHGLDKDVEIQRIAQEVYSGAKDIFDNNVPVSFVQRVAQGAGQAKQIRVSSTRQTGRPKKGMEQKIEGKTEKKEG